MTFAAIALALAFVQEAPQGTLTKHVFADSKIFPGTTREFTVYVPRQYDGAKPACVYVNQDGVQWNAPKVFDQLIASGEMPVTIGVFVTPGVVKAANPGALPRFNRSFEYDGLGDAYARFLLDELLPAVERLKTADGRAIKLSKSGNDRAIGGASSGAVCAFTAAWERPDAFTRVFSAIGTYVGLRGANAYPTLIRKYEPKPLRIFLQDGSADLNIYGGDWWMANQEMERALVFAGYQVAHEWGTEGHNGKDGTKAFPAAMRFLWKDWPAAIETGKGSGPLQEILIPGEPWKLVGEGYQFTEGPAANAAGELIFTDVPANRTFKVGLDGKVAPFSTDSKMAAGQAFGPDGTLFATSAAGPEILAFDAAAKRKVVADGIRGNDLVALHNGNLYVTEPGGALHGRSRLWLVKPTGEKKIVDEGLKYSNGITVSPDQTLLYVAEMNTHWVWSWQIAADGTLTHKQRYFHLHMADTKDDGGADGLRCDQAGRLYVATHLGVQVCDQAGRVNGIIPTPNGRCANLSFGGADFSTLYATCVDKVYARKTKAKGANAWQTPVKPPAPRL